MNSLKFNSLGRPADTLSVPASIRRREALTMIAGIACGIAPGIAFGDVRPASIDRWVGFKTLHSFQFGPDSQFGGERPEAGVIEASDGNLYGTASVGGSAGFGTIYRATPQGEVLTMHSFTGVDGDGAVPESALLQGSDSAFYGTTRLGGSGDGGTIFRMTADGILTVLYSFKSDGAHYAIPGGLIEASDGNFYGVTEFNGKFDSGTVYRMTPDGTITTLHSFSQSVNGGGGHPTCSLLQGSDGMLYGTTSARGQFNKGTLFRISLKGKFTKLHDFSGPDGSHPRSELIEASDGNFYGVAPQGGADFSGTIFKLAPDGVFTLVYTFGMNGLAGRWPVGALLQASDGNFYGTTRGGGFRFPYWNGSVFRMLPDGSHIDVLHVFDTLAGGDVASVGKLLETSAGALVGTTETFGEFREGSLFRIADARHAPPLA